MSENKTLIIDLDLSGGDASLSFPVDPKLIDFVKNDCGGTFDTNTKTWMVDLTEVDDVAAYARRIAAGPAKGKWMSQRLALVFAWCALVGCICFSITARAVVVYGESIELEMVDVLRILPRRSAGLARNVLSFARA